MDIKLSIIIFILICLLQIQLDFVLKKCKSNMGKFLIALHHVFSIYLYFGSILLGNHLFHFCVLFICFTSHRIIGFCPLTIYCNNICKSEEGTQFITLLNHIVGIYDKRVKYYYYFALSFIILYDLYMIQKEYKIIKW